MSKITIEDINKNMGHSREKKPIAYEQEAIQKAAAIVDEFIDFTDGVRCLFLVYRSKDGATHSGRHTRTHITRNTKEFENTLSSFIQEAQKSKDPLRIYSSVNERDVEKAIRQFKFSQLEADYFDETSRKDFYLDIKNRMVSAIMKPTSRKETQFLFDIDEPMTLDDALGRFDRANVEIIKQYPTKNGWHFITKPFNPETLDNYEGMNYQKDGIILLYW